jgi:dienelactone hydrolase
MERGWRIAGIAVVIAFVLCVAWLAHLQTHGPAHHEVELAGGIPGTFYLPGSGDPFFTMTQLPVGQRSPVVVLMHGFLSDNVMMSALARRLAENGYAVLAIDASGHGANRNPFSDTLSRPDALREDFKAAVDYLRHSDHVDGSRIVVMGHSMGAGATLDFATHEPDLSGAVMISGGWTLGPLRPRNALFIFAEHDVPDAIKQPSTALAQQLAGVSPIQAGKQYGDFKQGTAIEVVEAAGENHISMVYSAPVATTIVQWLDGIFGTQRTGPINIAEPRLRVRALGQFLFLFVLIVIGRVSGSLAAQWQERPGGAEGWIGVLLVAIALVVAMPLVATILPVGFFPMIVGDAQISWLLAASVLTVGYLALRHGLQRNVLRADIGQTLFAALLAFAAIYLCVNALSITLHRLSLTPERFIMFILGTLLVFPFWYSFELLVRRGGLLISTVLGFAGRATIIVLMGVGAAVGILPTVLLLVMPILVLLFVAYEIFAASAYSASRNLALIAIVETLWFVWFIAATNPITFKL